MPFHDVTAAAVLYGVFRQRPRGEGSRQPGAAMLNQADAYVNRRALRPLPPVAPPPAKASGLHDCGDVAPIGVLNHPRVAGRRHPFPSVASGRALFKEAWLPDAQTSNSVQPAQAQPFIRITSATAHSGVPATTAPPHACRADAAR